MPTQSIKTTEPQTDCPNLHNRNGTALEWRSSDGLVSYPDAVAEMERRVEAILSEELPELVWLLEHPPLYTAGTSAKSEDLLDPARFPVFRSGRGGQYTYHGPGQRVVYVMLNLNDRGRDLRCYINHLETWIIHTLKAFGLAGSRRSDRVGVWIPSRNRTADAKIAAIGVRVRRWVTLHGLSINVRPDLDHYAGIIPCGATGFAVTSLNGQGIAVPMSKVDAVLRRTFLSVFGGSFTTPLVESERSDHQALPRNASTPP